MTRARLFTIIGGIFGLVGLVLLGTGIAMAASTASFMRSAERTEGTVVGLEREIDNDDRYDDYPDVYWYPIVDYTVEGQQYSFESAVGSDPPAYQEGETVPVAYDPDDPDDARIASFGSAFFAPLILGGMGVVFTPIGAVLLVMGRRAARERAWLKQKGHEAWAEIAEVERERSVRVNGRHPYVVHATWNDERTGRTYTATSDYVRHNPGPSLQGRTHVRVLYDPSDPDRNLLELDSVR